MGCLQVRITLKNKMALRIGALLLMLTIILTGCSRLSKNCPIDFPNSKWVCEDPHIELVVDGQQRYRTTLIEDGKEKQFSLDFASETGLKPVNLEMSRSAWGKHCLGAARNTNRIHLRLRYAKIIFGTVLIPN